jgi:hypothetical protein
MNPTRRSPHISAKGLLLIVCATFSLMGALAALASPARASAPHLRPSIFATTYFQQAATAANVSGDSMIIDNPYTNGNPNAILLVNQDWNLDYHCGCVYNNHPIGTWYNLWIGKWEIFNEDGSAIPLNAKFDAIVWAAPVNEAGRTIYTHVAGPQSGVDYTDISNSISDNNPNALVYVTPNWNPPGSSQGVFDNHNLGVWYNTSTGHWSIFNEDGTAMPSSAAFNVVVYASGDNLEFYTVTSTAANTMNNYTNLSSDWAVNGGLYAIHRFTPCFYRGCQNYLNHPLGSWNNLAAGHVSIFNEDDAPMPYGFTFNVMNVHF